MTADIIALAVQYGRYIAIKVSQRLKAIDVLSDLFILRGIPPTL